MLLCPPTEAQSHPQFEAILAAYLQAEESGKSPNRQEWLTRYPELADELQAFFDSRDEVPRIWPNQPLLQTPCRFGEYELLEEIAHGGMGIVYKARQLRPSRIVALKLILAGQLARPSDVERFHAEAEAAAILDHPNIVPIYEAGEDHGQHYFSMKLIEGPSLAKRLNDDRIREGETGETPADPRTLRPTPNVEIRKLVKVLATVAGAVHYAHQHGILHRDLKPGNILLDSSEQPYVTDFGLAKLFTGENTATQSGAILGTASYMAPEQAVGSKGLTTAADIYSLGAILYEVLTGRPPFREETALETLLHVREREPARPSDVHPKVDRDLETICLKCLERDPLRRYGSAEALAEDLDRWLMSEPIHARPVGRVERTWRRCRRNPVVSALLASVVMVAIVGLVGILGQWQVAVANEQKANASAVQAKEKEQEATQQRDEAQRQRDEARALAEQLRRTTYVAHVNLAKHAWDARNASRVLELLEQHRPKAGESNLRGFEWHYLNRLCYSELLTVKVGGEPYALSPDGMRVAGILGRSDRFPNGARTVRIWDAQTGQGIVTLDGHTHIVTKLAFSPDGKRLASGEFAIDEQGVRRPSDVKVWDTQTGREIVTLKGHTSWIRGVAFSPDGRRLASASSDQTVKVWDAQTGVEIFTLKGHTAGVYGVAFSPDGKRLASASYDQMVKIYDAQTAQEIFTLKGHTHPVNVVVFSSDSKRLASASDDQTVKVWDVENGRESLSLKGHNGGVNVVVFSPDGKRLASTGYDHTLKVWDAQTGEQVLTLMGTGSVAFSADGKRLFSAGNGEVKIWDAQTDPELRILKGHTKHVYEVAFSSSGKRLASASFDQTVKVWDVENGQETLTLGGHTSFVGSVAFSPDGKRLASGSGDRTVKVWDAATGQEVLMLKGHPGPIWSVAFSPDGKRLASGSGNNYDERSSLIPGETGVKVWDTETGRELLNLQGPAIEKIAFSPDGKRLAASSTSAVKVWDSQTGQEILTIKPGWGLRGPLFFSPDGKRLTRTTLSRGSLPNSVKVWDALTGQELPTIPLKGHVGYVWSAAFSPDEKRLASTAQDGTVKIWDAQTADELLTLKGTTRFSEVVFSPTGHLLAGMADDGTVAIWNATPLPEKP